MKDFDNTTVPISTADTCMKKNVADTPAGIRGKSSSSSSSNIYSAPTLQTRRKNIHRGP